MFQTLLKRTLWTRLSHFPPFQAQKQKFQSHTPGTRTNVLEASVSCPCSSEPEKLILFSVSVSGSLLLTAQRCLLGSSPTPMKRLPIQSETQSCLVPTRHKRHKGNLFWLIRWEKACRGQLSAENKKSFLSGSV